MKYCKSHTGSTHVYYNIHGRVIAFRTYVIPPRPLKMACSCYRLVLYILCAFNNMGGLISHDFISD